MDISNIIRRRLQIFGLNEKFYYIVICIILSVSINWYHFVGFMWPRPIWFLPLLSTTLIIVLIPWINVQKQNRYVLYFVIALVSFSMKASGYLPISSAGRDTRGFSIYVLRAIGIGQIPENTGIYIDAPYHILILTMGKIFSIGLSDLKFLYIFISSLFPLWIGLVCRRTMGKRFEAPAMVLSAPFVLFMRTPAVIEAEALAIAFFTLSLYSMILARDNSTRGSVLLFIFASLSSFVHLFYTVVIAISVLGGNIGVSLYKFVTKSRLTTALSSVFVTIAAGMLVMFRVLNSDPGGVESNISALLNFRLPDGIVELFIPQGGSAARGVAATSPGSGQSNSILPDKFFNYAQPLIFAFLSIIGFLYTISSGKLRKDSINIIFSGVILGLVIMTFLVATPLMRIQFRLYYFAGVLGIPFATVPIYVLSQYYNSDILMKKGVSILLIFILIVPFVTVGPLTPIGNDVDPRFGGQPAVLTIDDREQLDEFKRFSQIDKQVRVRSPHIYTGLVFVSTKTFEVNTDWCVEDVKNPKEYSQFRSFEYVGGRNSFCTGDKASWANTTSSFHRVWSSGRFNSYTRP